jgi:hypothetical protein
MCGIQSAAPFASKGAARAKIADVIAPTSLL